MNLIEAIKSGKPFRRSGLSEWKTKEEVENDISYLTGKVSPSTPFATTFSVPMSVRKVLSVSLADLLADDWEIQEPTVTITRSQFLRAYEVSYMEAWGKESLPLAIARKLGLEP